MSKIKKHVVGDTVEAGLQFMRQSAGKHAILLMILSVCSTCLQAANFFLIFESLGAAQFGQFRAALSFFAFSGIFHLGLIDGLFLNWMFSKTKPLWIEFFQVFMLTTVLALLLFFTDLPAAPALLFLGYVVIANMSAFMHNLFVAHDVYSTSVLQNIVVQLCLLVSVLAVSESFSSVALLWLMLAGQSLTFLSLLLYALPKKMISNDIIPNRSLQIWKVTPAIYTGFPVLIAGFFFLSFFNLDKVLFANHFDSMAFGYYTFASSVITIIAGVLASPVNILLSKIARVDLVSLPRQYTKLFLLTNMALLVCLPLIMLAFRMITYYLPKYQGAVQFLAGWEFVLIPALLLQVVVITLLKRLGKQKLFLYIALPFLGLMCLGLYALRDGTVQSLVRTPFVIAQALLLVAGLVEWALVLYNKDFRNGFVFRICMLLFVNILMVITYMNGAA